MEAIRPKRRENLTEIQHRRRIFIKSALIWPHGI
jgi:hypothetical protein